MTAAIVNYILVPQQTYIEKMRWFQLLDNHVYLLCQQICYAHEVEMILCFLHYSWCLRRNYFLSPIPSSPISSLSNFKSA